MTDQINGGAQPPMPSNHMVKAILTTLFCCLPFGIVAIVKASKVSSAYESGDYAGALQASKDANKWGNLAMWSAVIVTILYIVAIFAGVGGLAALGGLAQ